MVVLVAYESGVSNTPTTVSWTGGTPTGATAFTRQATNGYNDGVGDTQGAEIWTATVTSALTGVGVTHHNAISTGTIGAMLAVVYLAAGLDAAPGRFRVAITPYYFSLIDRDNPACPVRMQVIPSARELQNEGLVERWNGGKVVSK